jgi:hypothetical protein
MLALKKPFVLKETTIVSEPKVSPEGRYDSFDTSESQPVRISRYCMQEHKPVNNENWKLRTNPWMKTRWTMIREKILSRKR